MTEPFKIGLWGTSRGGKTTYVAMLYHVFLSRHDEWSIRAEDKSREFVERAFEGMFDNRSFPEKTVATELYTYVITRRQGQKQFVLEFLDAPGELFEEYYDRERRESRIRVAQTETEPLTADKTPLELFRYLRDCDGLLIFIDPARAERAGHHLSYGQLLYQLFEDLRHHRRETGRADPKVALCLVKVDGKDVLWNAREIDNRACARFQEAAAPDLCAERCAVFRQLGWQFMVNQLPGLIARERVMCFGLSSIGRFKAEPPEGAAASSEAQWQLNVGVGNAWQRSVTPLPPAFSLPPSYGPDLDREITEMPVTETYTPRSINKVDKIQPYHLLEPIEWLIEGL